MEAQLRRLRAAAREAEARTRRPRRSSRGDPGASGRAPARCERRVRLANGARRRSRTDWRAWFAAWTPRSAPRSTASSRSIRKTRSSADPRSRPGGAGPGLKAAPSGSKAVSRRHFGSKAVDSALVALERRVDALARAAASGAPMTPATRAPPGVPPARSALREAPLEGGALELTSLRRMMRAAQTELGALSGRVEAVETKVREAGRLERDLRSARLTEKRAEERQNRTSVERSSRRRAARASERAAAAARDVSGCARSTRRWPSLWARRERACGASSQEWTDSRGTWTCPRDPPRQPPTAPGRRRGPPSPPPKAPRRGPRRWPARSEGSRGHVGLRGVGGRAAHRGAVGGPTRRGGLGRGSGTGGGVGGQVRDHRVRERRRVA